jgi:hypothetical protein
VGLQPHETPPARFSKNQVRGQAAPKPRRIRNRSPSHPSHAQRSPQADSPGVIPLHPASLSDRSPQRGRNTLAPVVRLGATERPRVSARLSGRKNHCVKITFVLYQGLWLQPNRIRPNPRRERGASAPRNPPSIKESSPRRSRASALAHQNPWVPHPSLFSSEGWDTPLPAPSPLCYPHPKP